MRICLEGERGDWGWFEASLREPDFGLDWNEIKSVCGTDNPAVIDIEYEDDEPYKDLLKYDGMGYTTINSLIKSAQGLLDFEDYELEQIAAYINVKGGSLQDAMNSFENASYWKSDNSNIEDFAQEFILETGDYTDTDFLEKYFDYASLGQELLDDPDYEPLGDGNAWDEGELYIDEYYGGALDLFIKEKDPEAVFDYYFDLPAYARNLKHGCDYDEETGIWVLESRKRNYSKRKVNESRKHSLKRLCVKTHNLKEKENSIDVMDLVSDVPAKDIANHGSDLYLRKTPQTSAIINSLPTVYRKNVTTFIDQIDHVVWYEVPFVYHK